MNTKDIMPSMKEAEYTTASVKDYRGNPLFEALPEFTLASDISDKFGRFPLISKGDRLSPRADRILMLTSRLNNYLEPLVPHYDVIDTINLITRAGYAFRNPLNEAHQKSLIKFYRSSKADRFRLIEGFGGPSTAPSYALFGPSGTGKSTIVDRALELLGHQVLLHSKYKLLPQVVWLKVDCPPDGSLKQLLLSILAKLDTMLGTAYREKVGKKNAVDELILSVVNIIVMHNLGVLVIDEIQHLLDASGVGQAKMLNFFVTFANEAKIPVVSIGTPRALDMLQGTFREARRVASSGAWLWNVLDDTEWRHFISGLWVYQWTKKFVPLTDELSNALREQTQGIHALVVRLFQLIQFQAIRDESECITKDLIIKVADAKFKLVRPMLDAIRDNDKIALARYEDLFDKGMKELNNNLDIDSSIALTALEHKRNKREFDERIRTISVLVQMKYPEDQVQEIVTKLFDAKPDLSCDRAVRTFLESMLSDTKGEVSSPSLMDIVKSASADDSPTKALSSAGIIASTAGGN